jgi:hypothetical protein
MPSLDNTFSSVIIAHCCERAIFTAKTGTVSLFALEYRRQSIYDATSK